MGENAAQPDSTLPFLKLAATQLQVIAISPSQICLECSIIHRIFNQKLLIRYSSQNLIQTRTQVLERSGGNWKNCKHSATTLRSISKRIDGGRYNPLALALQLKPRIGRTYSFSRTKAQQQPQKASVPQLLIYSLKTASDI